MLNLKKKVLIILAVIFAIVLIGATQVHAAPNANGELTVNGKYLFGEGQTIETVSGATYNKTTNTLTLNGYNGNTITAYYMNDFKINVVGENTITTDLKVNSNGIYSVLGTLEITGTGTLNFKETNISDATSLHPEEGAIHSQDSYIVIDGPTIKMQNLTGSGISARTGIEIKNSNIDINVTGINGIYTYNNSIDISNSKVNSIASKYAIAGDSITIEGNSTITAKTTGNDAITLYADQGNINFATEGSIVLEKANKGILSSPQPVFESITGKYSYDIVNENNKITYTYKSKTLKTHIDKIEIDGTDIVPVIGQEPKPLNINSEKYTLISERWMDENYNPVTKFEEAKEYRYIIRLEPKANYYFSDETEAIITKMDSTYVWGCDDDGIIEIETYKLLPGGCSIINGANQTYIIGKDTKAVIEVDQDSTKYLDIMLDGEYIDYDCYDIDGDNNKTIITFKQEFLDKLSVGKHTLKIIYEDYKNVETEITITDKEETSTGATTPPEVEGKEEIKEELSNPKTGDNIILYVMILMGSVSGIILINKFNKK